MTIVTTTDFRANMTKYFDMASNGERVVVQSRRGDVTWEEMMDELRD